MRCVSWRIVPKTSSVERIGDSGDSEISEALITLLRTTILLKAEQGSEATTEHTLIWLFCNGTARCLRPPIGGASEHGAADPMDATFFQIRDQQLRSD